MTNTYSLAIYAITISKRGERQDTQVLSDYDNGYDFLSEMHDLFKSWCYDSERGDNFIPVNKDLDYAFRIAQNHDNHPLLHRMGRYLKGTIEAGEFGTREDVVNVNTGEVRYSKTRIDAVMRPFYFMFYIPDPHRLSHRRAHQQPRHRFRAHQCHTPALPPNPQRKRLRPSHPGYLSQPAH